MRILVLHGPNLNLLGERPGDERGRGIDALNSLIQSKAAHSGVEVRIFQSNHEGELVDRLHAERRWADGVIINPGALAASSYVLREALAAVGKPAIEVQLEDAKRHPAWRGKSVLRGVCKAHVSGHGFDSYLIALQRLAAGGKRRGKSASGALREAEGARAAKTVGPRNAGTAVGSAATEKSIGRGRAPTAGSEKSIGRDRAPSGRKAPATELLTRATVRQKVAERLAGTMSPDELSSWARARWLEVQRGLLVDPAERELLEGSLQTLVLSAAMKTSDEQLLELMAQLDG